MQNLKIDCPYKQTCMPWLMSAIPSHAYFPFLLLGSGFEPLPPLPRIWIPDEKMTIYIRGYLPIISRLGGRRVVGSKSGVGADSPRTVDT